MAFVSDNNIAQDFTKEELRKLTVVQLKELFGWYGLTYKGKKEDAIEKVFVLPVEEENIPCSVRIRRINDGN